MIIRYCTYVFNTFRLILVIMYYKSLLIKCVAYNFIVGLYFLF